MKCECLNRQVGTPQCSVCDLKDERDQLRAEVERLKGLAPQNADLMIKNHDLRNALSTIKQTSLYGERYAGECGDIAKKALGKQ